MKIFINTILALFAVLFANFCIAQNELGKADDYDRIALDVIIPKQIENIPDHAQRFLESRLLQVASENGLGGEGVASRFALTAKVEAVTKDITHTAPAMQVYNFEVYLYIVDNIDRIVLSSTSMSTKGAGSTKNKAYINGLKKINLNNEKLKDFLESGKKKIISYYNSKCDVIIARADALAAQNKFKHAIYTLASIPEVCQECYLKSLNAIASIYQEYIDHECSSYLNIANALFAANPNSTGAEEAVGMISLLDPDSECFGNAAELISKIEKKMRSDEDREWSFMERVWSDKVGLEQMRIKAYRDVGGAFGENQQPVNYDVLWLFD